MAPPAKRSVRARLARASSSLRRAGGRVGRWGPLRRAWASLLGRVRIDTRSLAAFRIAAGALILLDLLSRSRNFHLFYTDEGVVPTSLAVDLAPYPLPSVYNLSGDPTVTAVLFGVHALVGLALLVGYRSRVASVLAFVLVVSLDLRNPLVLSYADTLFAVLLFWAMFLPLGERWSVDAVHAGREPRASVTGVGSALILSQMVVMYVVNGIHKTESPLWLGGEATVLILGLDHITFLLGDLARSVPGLLRAGGLLWVGMLLTAWLLIVLRGRARTGLVLLFAGGHLTLAATTRIGAFSFVCLAGLLLFLQASAWTDARTVAEHVGAPTAVPAPVASRLEAVATALPDLGRPARGLRSRRFSRLRGTARLRLTVLGTVAIVVCSAAVLSLGGPLSAGDGGAADPIDRIEGAASAVVDFQTEWSIFAPHPRVTDQYFVFAAETADGEVIDVYSDRPLSFDRPADELQRQYPTYRHRFYMNSVRSETTDERVREQLAERLCETAETDDGDGIVRLELFHVTERVTLDTVDSPADRERSVVSFHRHGCGDHEPDEVASPP